MGLSACLASMYCLDSTISIEVGAGLKSFDIVDCSRPLETFLMAHNRFQTFGNACCWLDLLKQ